MPTTMLACIAFERTCLQRFWVQDTRYISLCRTAVSELVQLGCRFIDTPIERRGMNPIHDSKLFHQYRAILKEVKPDLVLTYTIKPNIYGGLACRMTHIPYAVNITGRRLAQEVCAGALQTGVERCKGRFF